MKYHQSMVNMFLRCPQQYKYRYVDNLVMPSSAMAKQGTSFHAGVDHNYGQKVESKKDLPLDEVLDAVATTFDKVFSEETQWGDEEKSEGIENVKGVLKDETILITEKYHKEKAPTIQPVASEVYFELPFENVDFSIAGTIDLIDDKDTVHDHKTTGKAQSVLSESYLLQGILYSLGAGKDKVDFDYIIKPTKKLPTRIETISLTVDEAQKRYALGLISKVDGAINSNIFYPKRDNFLCSQKFCGYWQQCQHDFGGYVKL